jgi:hypothetical protein
MSFGDPQDPEANVGSAEVAERYQRAAHAMQSGVAAEMAGGSRDTEAKHLRVGVNSALVSQAALVRVLVEKGIITNEEYALAVCEEMEREVKRYEERLTRDRGVKVTLA